MYSLPIIRVHTTFFAIYGYLGHNFRWMMKKVPEASLWSAGPAVCPGIFTLTTAARKQFERQWQRQRSVLPEECRWLYSRRGAHSRRSYARVPQRCLCACHGVRLAVVPITIDGAYKVMPRSAILPRPDYQAYSPCADLCS